MPETRDYDPSEGHWSYKQPEGKIEGRRAAEVSRNMTPTQKVFTVMA